MRTLYLFCAVVIIAFLGCSRDQNRIEDGSRSVDPNKPIIAPLSIHGEGIKGIPGSSGEIVYYPLSSGSLKATVTLRGLKKSYVYVLTLNGKVGKSGNKELIEVGEEDKGEGVVDTWMPEGTDPNGCWVGEFPFVSLPPVYYDIKFLVKDPVEIPSDWINVMHYDHLRFTITK